MLKIGLCEDNEIQHNQILSFLETISLPKHAINSFYKGNDLYNSIQEAMKEKEPYDIVIMDIDLPDGNGIKFSKQINVFSPHTIIIYMTSYEDYVSDVYDTEHIYFILKKNYQKYLPHALSLANEALNKQRRASLKIFWNKEEYNILQKDIFYMERKLRTTFIVTPTHIYPTSEKLEDLLKRLGETFAISHRSFIVNLKMVQEITKDSALLVNGTSIPISRSYYKALKDQVNNLIP
ncbi:LytR/AlgR family response regulator transcription factor [Catenibacterium mitsuokai]|uniref:LytR/AlgR family response regulator transcription factor n=1 Tax=Catenibacterium mitsuokai TaxID=100886 RepID=UPI003F889771